MNKIESISQKYHAVLADTENSITETETKLQKAQEKLTEATEAEKAAVQSADAKAYYLAKKKLAEASAEIEMCEKRLDYIHELPLISKQEFRAVIAEIDEEFKVEQAEAREKALDLAEQLYAIYADLAKKANDASGLISFLFYDICRETNGMKMPKLSSDFTLAFAKMLATQGFYEEHRGKINKEDSFRLFFG